MTPPITIKPLLPQELEQSATALADLLIEVVHGGSALGFLVPLDRTRAREYWLSLVPDLTAGSRVILVARQADTIVGSGQLEFSKWPNARHRAELQKLFVSASLRGRGVGKLLMSALHAAAHERDRSLIILGTRRGGSAEQFYRMLGYHEVGVIPGYAMTASGERHDTVRFYRDLRDRHC